MRLPTLLLALFTLILSVSCATPPSFCKCTCFTNSTIIELTPKTKPASAPNLLTRSSALLEPRAPAAAACSQCNRAFCIAQNLPICKNAKEEDIITACFQRDSTKDQVIVLGFICTTLGLLGWAAGKRVLLLRKKAAGSGAERGNYVHVPANEG